MQLMFWNDKGSENINIGIKSILEIGQTNFLNQL